MKYMKKPIAVEAWQICGFTEKPDWLNKAIDDGTVICYFDEFHSLVSMSIHTLEGWTEAMLCDWIIQGVRGELYPCAKDIFAETYEPVEELSHSHEEEADEEAWETTQDSINN